MVASHMGIGCAQGAEAVTVTCWIPWFVEARLEEFTRAEMYDSGSLPIFGWCEYIVQ
jgi:hypothetical protein